jgi:hypothetical protein
MMRLPRTSRLALFAGALLLTAACAAGGGGSTDEGGGDGSGSGGGGTTSVAGGAGPGGSGATTTTTDTSSGTGGGDLEIDAGGSSSDGGGSDGCSEEAKKVYVLDKAQALYRFDPATLAFGKVGPLACPATDGATTFSMAVDRSGTAWVLYNDGNLFQVDTKTAACKATSYAPNQQGYKKFGMGFATDAPGGTAETLFLANEFGLAKLDRTTLAVTPLGQFGFSAAAELTGTSDAKLFGFFFGFPPYLSEIDKGNSSLKGETPLDAIDAGTGFAFAFWGGDFWVFAATSDANSRVYRYSPQAGTTKVVVAATGFKIVGAGVSTCAPLTAVPK